MLEYRISENLHNLLKKEGINVSFNKYDGEASSCVALIQIKSFYFTHEFKRDCGKPKTIEEIEDALASGVRDYIGYDEDCLYRYYDLADAYFREHIEEIHISEALDFAKEIINKLKTMLRIMRGQYFSSLLGQKYRCKTN